MRAHVVEVIGAVIGFACVVAACSHALRGPGVAHAIRPTPPTNALIAGEYSYLSARHDTVCVIDAATRHVRCSNDPGVGQPSATGNRVDPTIEAMRVAVGGTIVCALEVDHRVQCWGSEYAMPRPADGTEAALARLRASGKREFPSDLRADAIAAGAQFSVAIKSGDVPAGESNVVVWGDSRWIDIPRGFLATSISAGLTDACMIGAAPDAGAEASNVACTGQQGFIVPAGLQASAVAVGDEHVCAIRSADRRVECFNNGAMRQQIPPADIQADAIAAGDYETCAVEHGTRAIRCWGTPGVEPQGPPAVPDGGVLTASGAIATIALGAGFSCVLAAPNSALECWGNVPRWLTPPPRVPRPGEVDGVNNCGADYNGDCAESLLVPGGTFNRSNDPQYPATVSSFRLDKYAITVGRMRQFVAAWTRAVDPWRPQAGSGKHTHLNGGRGLETQASTPENHLYEPGWDASWNDHVLANGAELLKCEADYQTWADVPNGRDRRAQNCLNWYVAYAFCIWNNGFLPSEAEWNYAAAGGAEQREYPWSVPANSRTIDASYANYNWNDRRVLDVGSKSPRGDGLWGHADLAGNVWKWNLDSWTAERPVMSDNLSYIDTSWQHRVILGGSFGTVASDLLSSFRSNRNATNRFLYLGAQCARTP